MKRNPISSRAKPGDTANAEKKLNKRAIRQTFAGYARADRFIEAEKRAWLQSLTDEQARQIFDDLNQDGDDWKKFAGDMSMLEIRRLESKIQGRRIFDLLSLKLARHRTYRARHT